MICYIPFVTTLLSLQAYKITAEDVKFRVSKL